MGVSIEVWRARIGTYAKIPTCSGSFGKFSFHFFPLVLIYHFFILLILLVIGNVEMNPGPCMKRCHVCNYEARSINDHLKHQRIHEGDFNFIFKCPLFTCHYSYQSFAVLNSHVSHHNADRKEVRGGGAVQECVNCGCVVSCFQALCYHFLDHHLKSNVPELVKCPNVSVCGSGRTFLKRKHLASHLSQYHPGWREDYGEPGVAFPAEEQPNLDQAASDPESMEVDATENVSTNHDSDVEYDDGNLSDSSDSDNFSDTSDDSYEDIVDHGNNYSNEEIISLLAKFYAMAEGKLIIPTKSVQKISNKLTFISEILQDRLQTNLEYHLKKAGLPEETITHVTSKVLGDDPLFNSHHITAPGVSLTTNARRKTYYRKHFKYVAPVERNLRKSPGDRSVVIQYVCPKKTLNVFLKDHTVQEAIDKSFSDADNNDPTIIRNYTDGSVFKKRDVPRKRIDLFVFQDAFKCVQSVGPLNKNYKTLGVYMTIGNLKPHQRSKLRAKRLLFLTLEKALGSIKNGIEKAFKKLVKDLKQLEVSGIEYKGEIIPIRLQFLIGDHLGQHTVGGFLESFSSVHYFCRFCRITRDKFREDRARENPVFRTARWRTPRHYQSALQKREERNVYSYKGIKRNSVFNGFQHFHVCDPGQPSCIGHDLFLQGVVDCDLAAMIQLFVQKGWFTYDLLNRRIRDFTCVVSDAPNKPAPVHLSGKKLGGNGVQNWTLLRLLPIIIGDKVDTSDEVWHLYLLLKIICELVCAPALKESQIDLMRTHIDDYMTKRKCLPNKYKPKHHYFSHIPDLWRLFGPLIHLWTLGFEQCHQFFKRVAQTCKNFVNLSKLLASKHQLMQAYQSTGPLFPSEAIHHSMALPLVAESYNNSMKDYIRTQNFSSDASVFKSITIQDICYQEDKWLILENVVGECAIMVGKIKLILCDNNNYKVIVKKYKAVSWEGYGIYKIVKRNAQYLTVSLDGALENPCPHATYKFGDKLCISLKHALLA